jgi:hypothetical protein
VGVDIPKWACFGSKCQVMMMDDDHRICDTCLALPQGRLMMLETREGGCHCGQVRFRATVDLDLLSQCSCSICTKKGILHLSVFPADFELLRGKDALTVYTFGTGVAQHPFCTHCGAHAFYVPRSQPDKITVNAKCLDGIDGTTLKPTRSFDGRHWEDAQHKRISDGGHVAAAGLNGAETLKGILDRARA